jgi:iron-sulfur cluster repair protein YtfE (RIC family)
MHAHVCNQATAVTGQSPGEGMVAELKWVHAMIRRDLETVRWLAEELERGLPGEQAAVTLDDLAVGSALWQLKINCLQYCRFVHAHHHAESALLFPRLRASNPALGPVVDKLEADHARVSDLLDDVTAAATALAAREDAEVRKRLISALDQLSLDLLEHLQYEEDNISGTLRTWTSWGSW